MPTLFLGGAVPGGLAGLFPAAASLAAPSRVALFPAAVFPAAVRYGAGPARLARECRYPGLR